MTYHKIYSRIKNQKLIICLKIQHLFILAKLKKIIKKILKFIPNVLLKIVILMKRVKDRLLIHNEIEAVADAEWITKEIVTHNIYKVKNEDKEQNIFFDEYSNIKSEKMFNKTIIKSGKIMIKKNIFYYLFIYFIVFYYYLLIFISYLYKFINFY